MPESRRIFYLFLATICVSILVWQNATIAMELQKSQCQIGQLNDQITRKSGGRARYARFERKPMPKQKPITREEFEYCTSLQLLGDPKVLTFRCPSKPQLEFKVHHLGEGRFYVEQVNGWFTITQIVRLIWNGQFEGSAL